MIVFIDLSYDIYKIFLTAEITHVVMLISYFDSIQALYHNSAIKYTVHNWRSNLSDCFPYNIV